MFSKYWLVTEKYAAKVFTFSLSLRAQVLYAFLISGMRCIGCFNRLVGFQSEQSLSALAAKPWICVLNISSLILFMSTFNFLISSFYLGLSSGFRLIFHLLLSFSFSLILSFTSHCYSWYLAWDLSSGVALQAKLQMVSILRMLALLEDDIKPEASFMSVDEQIIWLFLWGGETHQPYHLN